MSSFNGHAFVSGLTGTGAVVTLSGYGTVFADTIPIQHVSKLTEHIGSDGNMGALQWDDEHYEISMTFRPAKKDAHFNTSKVAFFVPKGSKVTLSGFHAVGGTTGELDTGSPPAPKIVEVLNADWIVCGDTSVTLNAAGNADIQLALRRYPGNLDIHATVPLTAGTLLAADEE